MILKVKVASFVFIYRTFLNTLQHLVVYLYDFKGESCEFCFHLPNGIVNILISLGDFGSFVFIYRVFLNTLQHLIVYLHVFKGESCEFCFHLPSRFRGLRSFAIKDLKSKGILIVFVFIYRVVTWF